MLSRHTYQLQLDRLTHQGGNLTATIVATTTDFALEAAANAGFSALAASAAISTINNGGDLGKMLKEVTSGSNLENIVIAALSAGATSGIVDKYFSNTADTAGTLTVTDAEGVVTSQAIPGYVNNTITYGFHLNTSAGMAGFAEHAAVQAFSNAAISTAIKGGSFTDNFKQALIQQAGNVVAAYAFNQVGDWAQQDPNNIYKDGSFQKVLAHALVGGLVAEVTGGDFKTGAMAAGASEAMVDALNTLVNNNPRYLLAASQIVGATAAGLVGGDVNQGAQIAQSGTAYNYLSHQQHALKDSEIENCKGKVTCEINAELKWQAVSRAQDAGLVVGFGGGLGLSSYELVEGVWQLVTHAPETMAMIKELSRNPELRQQFGDSYFADLDARAALMQKAYEDAGWDGSVTAGVEAARFTADIAGLLYAAKGIATVTTKLSEAAVKVLDATNGAYANLTAVNIANIGMEWGKSMEQGIPWETYSLAKAAKGTVNLNTAIKQNFSTFDLMNFDTGLATSLKTLDTTAITYTNRPSSITSLLNSYVRKVDGFVGDGKAGTTLQLTDDMIKSKEISLAIPLSTTPAQLEAIAKSVEYAASKGIQLKVTKVK